MALIVETGTGLDPTANSYISLADARAYAALRGETLATADADAEIQLILAMDYLEALRLQYQGEKTVAENPLQWPRSGVLIDCVEIDDDLMPQELIEAQAQLAVEQENGIELSPSDPDGLGVMKKEVVGPLETEYFSGTGNSTGQPTLTKVDDLLAPLFNACGPEAELRTLRI